MKSKFKIFLASILMLFVQMSFAQEKTVSGIVTDQNGLPIPGVNVLLKGATTGTQTDFDGNFKMVADQGQILVFSYLGLQTKEVAATSNMKVQMKDDAVELEGVVVTALGIKREKKALGYASQKLEGSDLNQTPTNNFINNLAGKVAGLEIRKNANFGGSSNIVLRGTKSITGNNQALMVVDGVPINNANLNTADAGKGRDGFDFGNSASDIDPNSIESLTVLKGAAATALYGSQASNGAIMITTKKGKQNTGLGITFSSTTSTGMYDKDTFPKYQKTYGQGYAGPDSFIPADVNGDGVDDLLAPSGDDASYGNAFDPALMVYQWNAFVEGNPNFGQPTSWVAAKNDPGKFFQNSLGVVNSLNLNGGDDKSTFNFGFANNYETGILPNSRLNRNNLNGNFSRKLSEKLNVAAFLTFTDQSTVGRNNVGYGDNLMGSFRQWWPVNVDIKELQQEYFRNHQNVTWNMADPTGGDLSPAFWNNPYWDRYQNYSSDERTRIITGGNISYDLTKDLNVLGRVTVDTSNDRQEMRKAVGSHAEEFGLSQLDETSGYNLYTRSFLQTTYDFLATYDFKLNDDFGAKLLGGTSFIKAKVDEFEGSTTGGLAAPNLYTLANSNVFVAPVEEEYNYEKFGVFGQLSLDFKKTLYLEGSYRLDNTTALHPNHDNYSYYSIGASFLFSEIFKKDWLDLGKLRASYAEVGNDPANGRLGARLNNGLVGSNPTFGNSAVFVEYDKLRNENQKSWEFGLEAALLNRRFNFDMSVYKTNTFNQVINVPQSSSTGYASSQINAGELQNQGIEVALSGYPVKNKNFQWMIGVNWSKNENELIKLDEGRSNLQLATFQSGVSLNATVGQPYGTLRGSDFVYDANGNKVIDEDGFYVTEDDKVLGDIQADWIAGITNRITYKNLSFNFLIDIKKGGDLFSLDQEYGQYTGVLAGSDGNNDLGNPIRDPLTGGPDSGGVILDGVFEDGTPNDIRIDASTAGAAFGSGAAPNKAFIYDASYVKLREVGLTYTVPLKLLERTAIKGMSVSFLGNNLWIIDKKLPFADPEAGTSSGNIQGYQSGVMPSEKVYSFNVKVNF
ncbi:SusC/RagA family TonB-linked outer membrane protein [Flavobacterium sp. GT3R68]|uniref:SusC/RagA family TonB-linked outer membrane protein n=1 Tax=Flavobacterium sp. GT3R68 TaxID=2594437 RepID=UPI000F882FB6|nr:SusC/RagA family TonB-linked outer membrane protein [Flavobacterium sp. GT3R68]RTY88485.1 SusC/RagA family TonB-linked outer membrane protein [Flavobacterium sp. GSN2]TRW92585.1 SusC/RagA family TonB-linked outer membrane protein [Flavobacterium sp. GT3R68]